MASFEALLHRIPAVSAPETKVIPNNYSKSPFTPYIVEAKLPRKFVVSSFRLYDGKMDPEEHVAVYKNRMLATNILAKIRKVCMCRTFGMSLAKPTLQWYASILTGSISSFIKLHQAFKQQYSSNQNIEKCPNVLYVIRKQPKNS